MLSGSGPQLRRESPPSALWGSATWPWVPGCWSPVCARPSPPGASHRRAGEAQRSRAQAGENSGKGRGVPAGPHRSVLAIALLRTRLSSGSKLETASHRGRCGRPVGGKGRCLRCKCRQSRRWSGLDRPEPQRPTRVHATKVEMQLGGRGVAFLHGAPIPLSPGAPFPPTLFPVPFSHLLLASPHLSELSFREVLGAASALPLGKLSVFSSGPLSMFLSKRSGYLPTRQSIVYRLGKFVMGFRYVVLRISVATNPSNPLIPTGYLRLTG